MRSWLSGIVVLIGIGLIFSGPAAAEPEWPGFRGPGHDGAVPQAKLFEGEKAALTLGWKRALGSGYSATAVGNGRLVTMFADGDADVLAAFDAASGDELWRYRISDTYAGHDGSHDGPISTPLIHGGRVYGLGAWGHLFAVDAETGEEVWTAHMVDDLGSTKPYYGFTTSPVMADGVLVLLIGSEEEAGKSVAGLNPDDGTVLWTTGEDKIAYHSPVVATLGGHRQVVAAGLANIYGLDARSGDVLWSYEHGGDERAMGGGAIVPLPAGDDRIFLMNRFDSSVMLQITEAGGEYEVTELWLGNGIKQSYVQPVYHDGYLYGMNNRIFTCVDAANGEVKWRSREPGDGFPTVVGDHLVVMTKPGSLHVIEATPEAYREVARLDLFDEHSWSEVAYAGGSLFARSMAHLARIDPGSAGAEASAAVGVPATGFGRFLAEVGQAPDAEKSAIIDAFVEEQASFPLVEESGLVHFLYRGEAGDVGIVGDMIGFRREDPMTRVDGTDLFYYSTRLEPDAAVTYGYITDFAEEPVADPHNPRSGKGLFGDEVSWFAMPSWRAPDFHREAEKDRQGRTETVEWKSEVREGAQRTAEVYLPAGYDSGDRRYPVLYVHDGKSALERGRMKNALDQLIGRSIEPVIAVFVFADEENRRDLRDREGYLKMVVEELVPTIDERFRTIADPLARASVGSGAGANVALVGGLAHANVFGRVGTQFPRMRVGELDELEPNADERPLVLYMDWGTYHMRSPHEAWDYADESRKLWARLREAGYRPAGGEVPEGFSWDCWRAHTDELLAALFPLKK